MAAVLPKTERLKGVADTDLDGFLDRFHAEAPLLMRVGTVAGAALVVLAPALTVKVPVPAFLLPETLRDEHIYKLSTHPNYLIRQTTFLVKMVAGLAWGQDADVRSDLGVGPLGPDPGTWRDSF